MTVLTKSPGRFVSCYHYHFIFPRILFGEEKRSILTAQCLWQISFDMHLLEALNFETQAKEIIVEEAFVFVISRSDSVT